MKFDRPSARNYNFRPEVIRTQMKLLDYFMIDHIARKNARAVAREIERNEERRKEAEQTATDILDMFRLSPVATFLAFASFGSVVYTFFSGHRVACWSSLFVLMYSLSVSIHNSISRGRGVRWYAAIALCSALSFSGVFLLLSLGHGKAGIALAAVGFVGFVAVLVASSDKYGDTDSPDRG